MSFTWVPFYREVAARVLEYEDRQDELLDVLREMKKAKFLIVPLEETQADGTIAPSKEIDPFTFLSIFSSADAKDSEKKCLWLKKRWKLQVVAPKVFDGRVSAEAHNPGLYAPGKDERSRRKLNSALWKLAKQAFAGDADNIDAELFNYCIKEYSTRIQKINTGLSWINPSQFLSSTSFVKAFIYSREDAPKLKNSDVSIFSDYRSFLEGARKINPDFVALAHAARLAKFGETNNIVAQSELPKEKSQIHPMTQPTKSPLNQILYGPPGTGKTYSTIKRAVEIITGEKHKEHDEAKTRFDELRKNGQIEFVTFHQSFSYEEFIEGLRPILDEDGEGQARYHVRDGVLKTMALRATVAAQTAPTSLNFEAAWTELKHRVEKGELTEVPGRTLKSSHELVFEDDKLYGENVLSQSPSRFFSTSKQAQQKAWAILPVGRDIKSTDFNTVKVAGKGDDPFGAVIHNKIREISVENAEQVELKTPPRYVLIVDEINRGNISKILGDLITLLEPDKRIGEENELRVQLPVSGESFALPPNLYLLGTMNTADKSLALLDIALRRRFDFIEMAPDFELFPNFARDVLIQLNLRLEAALDREHRIGHAYFMKCENAEAFNAVFRAKIIPLLQEFFYNDWDTLRAVLGESGETGRFIVKLKAPDGMKAKTKWRWWFDADGAGSFNFLEVLRNNYGVLPSP